MTRYPGVTRRRLLHLAGIGLTGTAGAQSAHAAADDRAAFVYPAQPEDDIVAAVRANNGIVMYDYANLDFLAAWIPSDQIQQLEQDRRVGGLESDVHVGADRAGVRDDAGASPETAGADRTAGSEESETDAESTAPTVETCGVTAVRTDSAIFRGALTDLGSATAVTVRFDGRSTGAESWTALGDRTLAAPGTFDVDVTLNPDVTEYEVRAVAESAYGVVTGATETFTTESAHPSQDASWGHDRIFGDNTDAKHETYATATGAGVNVGILDTGIQHDHRDLDGNVRGGVNFSAGKHWGDDDIGHGTHVGGIVAAADNGLGTIGVAPDANLWSVKVFHDGKAFVSDIIAGIDWCMENDIEIISMSFYHSACKSATVAIETAYERGHLIVAASANADNDEDGSCSEDTIPYPAEHDATVAVTAMGADDTIASYSSVGPDGEVMAPGTNINAPIPDNAYGRKNGTSMACPMVSGVAALAWEACEGDGPDVSVRDTVRAVLRSEGETVLDTCEEGAGLVRADHVVDTLSG